MSQRNPATSNAKTQILLEMPSEPRDIMETRFARTTNGMSHGSAVCAQIS